MSCLEFMPRKEGTEDGWWEILDQPDAFGNIAYWHQSVIAHYPPKVGMLTSIDRTETKTKDPNSGGEKGSKLARFSLIPPEFLWNLAEHYGKGAKKYADRNWEKGYNWGLTCDALERHYHLWKLGEQIDPETGSHHLIAMAWHVIALFTFELRGLGKDDVRLAAQSSQSSASQSS